MDDLNFYTRKISIECLRYSNLSNFCHQKVRYNCITDLILKGEYQIKAFIDRANDLYQKYLLTQKTTDSIIINNRLKIYLDVVFCKKHFEAQSSGFPCYEFLSFNILEKDRIKSSGLGVMLSSYFHDLDRDQIEGHTLKKNDINLSILFWKSLFYKTCLNGGFPPLQGQTPVFIFPHHKRGDTVRSFTNDYMKYLGLKIDIGYTLDDIPLRMFYQSIHPKLNGRNLYFAFIAIGQACLEMTRPDIYCGNSKLLPFNRNKFTEEVKWQQKQVAIKWLANHGLLGEKMLEKL